MSASALSGPVFINCPYDFGYRPRLWAIIFALLDAGLRPTAAMAIQDGNRSRFDQLVAMIKSSALSIHDLSVADEPRFNMPYEVGLAHGLDNRSKSHRVLLLTTSLEKYRVACSDLQGVDPSVYDGGPADLVAQVSEWLQQFFDGEVSVPRPKTARSRFEHFRAELPSFGERSGHDITRPTWSVMMAAVKAYLKKHPPAAGEQGW